MLRANVLRTTAFKLAGFYLVLFVFSTGAVLGVVHWFTAGFIQRHTEQTILLELGELREAGASRGREALLALLKERADVPRTAMIYAVAGADGTIAAGNLADWPPEARRGWLSFEIPQTSDSAAPHPAIAFADPLPDGGTLLVGHDMTERYLLRDQLLSAFFRAVFLAVLVGAAGAALVGRRAADRVEAINAAIDRIAEGAFSDRMPLAGTDDELDRLAGKLNRMLDEIARLMRELREVTDNVAHDLRTPLARLRARLELAASEPGLPAGHQALLDQTMAEIDRLLEIFGAILAIAAVEAGGARRDFAPVDLTALVHEVADLYGPVAEAAGLDLGVEKVGRPVVAGSRQLLAQALSNLVDNAVKYTPAGGRIRITARESQNGCDLVVSDTGPGIPPDQHDRVLERFVRLESHRGTAGHGLGLSLVAAVVRLHGATLSLEDAMPGLRVRLRLGQPGWGSAEATRDGKGSDRSGTGASDPGPSGHHGAGCQD